MDDDSFWKKEFYFKRPIPVGEPMAGYDRNHPYFVAYQDGQVLLAEKTLKAILGVDSIQSILPDYIASPLSERIDKSDDPKLQTKLKLEEIRAFEKMYKEYYDSNPHGKNFPFTEPEIPEGFGVITDTATDDNSEQIMVMALVIGIITVSVGVGFYFVKKKH